MTNKKIFGKEDETNDSSKSNERISGDEYKSNSLNNVSITEQFDKLLGSLNIGSSSMIDSEEDDLQQLFDETDGVDSSGTSDTSNSGIVDEIDFGIEPSDEDEKILADLLSDISDSNSDSDSQNETDQHSNTILDDKDVIAFEDNSKVNVDNEISLQDDYKKLDADTDQSISKVTPDQKIIDEELSELLEDDLNIKLKDKDSKMNDYVDYINNDGIYFDDGSNYEYVPIEDEIIQKEEKKLTSNFEFTYEDESSTNLQNDDLDSLNLNYDDVEIETDNRSFDFDSLLEQKSLMSVEDIYNRKRLPNKLRDTVFMIEVYEGTLPENLPVEVKRESVLNILEASELDVKSLIGDAFNRIDILNNVLEDLSNKNELLNNDTFDKIKELEKQIFDLKVEMQRRGEYKETQNTTISYEIQRIVNIVEFINPE